MIALGALGMDRHLGPDRHPRRSHPQGRQAVDRGDDRCSARPALRNSFGWIVAEMGRQPFVVYGVLPTMSANSPGVSAFEVGLTMVLFTVIYGALAVVEVGLQLHFIKRDCLKSRALRARGRSRSPDLRVLREAERCLHWKCPQPSALRPAGVVAHPDRRSVDRLPRARRLRLRRGPCSSPSSGKTEKEKASWSTPIGPGLGR